jgi:O-acetyl-ADP-ribose deacetylase (regulator of RNase III)
MIPDRRIDVIEADITTLAVEAIVNAANERMLGGAGVDGAIHRAAGPGLLEQCRAIAEVKPGVRCPTGEARLTAGHDLPAKFVIHTVGPVWCGGSSDEEALLESCYRNSLALAASRKIRSIAFPAISTGVFGFPPDRAAPIAVRAVRDFFADPSSIQRVTLVCFGSEMLRTFERALREKA